jgi:hypothetical protein
MTAPRRKYVVEISVGKTLGPHYLAPVEMKNLMKRKDANSIFEAEFQNENVKSLVCFTQTRIMKGKRS